jgi:CheY-specific phosphatase CheX
MNKKFISALVHAVKQVFESMVGWDMTAKQLILGDQKNGKEDFSAIISFHGELCGAVVLAQTSETAGKIASHMLDVDATSDQEEIQDALGELLNMIVSVAKYNYNPDKDPFSISVPTIVIGKDYSIHVKSEEKDQVSWLKFHANGGEESVRLRLLVKQ